MFFVRIRLQPRSTRTDPHFPYPPLFRSQAALDKTNKAIAEAEGAVSGLDAAIRKAEAPMVAIPAAASALGKAAGGASGKVDRLGASARNAAQPLQDLLDSIFPEEAERRKLEADLDGLKSALDRGKRSEEHTSELQSLMRISYAVYC